MKTGPVFKIKYVNQIHYESKERHASNKPGTFWTGRGCVKIGTPFFMHKGRTFPSSAFAIS